MGEVITKASGNYYRFVPPLVAVFVLLAHLLVLKALGWVILFVDDEQYSFYWQSFGVYPHALLSWWVFTTCSRIAWLVWSMELLVLLNVREILTPAFRIRAYWVIQAWWTLYVLVTFTLLLNGTFGSIAWANINRWH